jgi:predicted RNA-binding protein with PIN domain
MDTLIIDGYSLLFRSAKAPETRTPDWVDRERLALIERITRMQAHLPRRIQLVFDGRESSRQFNLPSTRVELLYSSAAQSADLLIEELVRRHSDPARVNVVSSDRRVVERAQILGARATTCSSFLSLLEAESRGLRRDLHRVPLQPAPKPRRRLLPGRTAPPRMNLATRVAGSARFHSTIPS